MPKHNIVTIAVLALICLLILWNQVYALPLWLYAIPVTGWLMIVGLGSGFINSNYHVKTLCSGETSKRAVAITFDDGPHPVTEEVLDVLKKHNAIATFFCIGQNAVRYPHILARIIADGHTVGNHSFSHSKVFDLYRKNQVIAEISQTDRVLEEFTGRKIKLFRPPYGVTNPSIRRALVKTGHHAIGWNIRSLDTLISSEKTVFDRISRRISPGAIILLHDTSAHVPQVLHQLLKYLQSNNYEVVSLEQLLNINAYED